MILLSGLAALAGPVLEVPTSGSADRCMAAANAAMADLKLDLSSLGDNTSSDHVAVVVGVPCHHTEGIPSLAFSSRDAARVARTLADAGYQVFPLLGMIERDTFLESLDHAEAALAPGGTLLVYFSGHGVLREESGRLRRYLVFSDTEIASIRSTGLSVLTLEDRISRADVAQRIVVQDTCFAARPGGKSLGIPTEGSERNKGLPMPEPRLQLRAGDVRMYASRFFEQATESPHLRGSVYTHHLLASLTAPEADLDGDGCVDLREGHDWARQKTRTARRGLQNPQGYFQDAEAVPIGCTPGDPVRGVVEQVDDENWSVEIRDPRGTLIQRGGGALPAGLYRVEVGHLEEDIAGEVVHRTLMDSPLRLKAGAWVDLPQVVAERRTPIRTLGVDAGWRGAGSLPAVGAGVSGWYAWPQSRLGRIVGGVRMHMSSGPIDGHPCDLMRGTEIMALAGQTFTMPVGSSRLGVGPVAGVGGALRSFHQRCPDQPSVDLPVAPATIGQIGLRSQWIFGGSVAIAIEGGLHGSLVASQGIELQPMLRVGVGPTL